MLKLLHCQADAMCALLFWIRKHGQDKLGNMRISILCENYGLPCLVYKKYNFCATDAPIMGGGGNDKNDMSVLTAIQTLQCQQKEWYVSFDRNPNITVSTERMICQFWPQSKRYSGNRKNDMSVLTAIQTLQWQQKEWYVSFDRNPNVTVATERMICQFWPQSKR